MVKVIDGNFMVCADCIQVIANDDYTALDYYYSADEAQQRMDEINAGIDQSGGNICSGDPQKDNEFSISACDCCGSNLAGTRFHCVVLGGDKYFINWNMPGYMPENDEPLEFDSLNEAWNCLIAECKRYAEEMETPDYTPALRTIAELERTNPQECNAYIGQYVFTLEKQ